MEEKEEKPRWRWELEEPSKKKIIVPTLREKIELGLTNEEWIMICYEANKNSKCAREIGSHKLCDLCPKSTKQEIGEDLVKEIEVLLERTMRRLVYRRRY